MNVPGGDRDNYAQMKVTCIVVAGGRGRRLKAVREKAFVSLCGRPLIFYALKAFEGCSFVDRVVVVVPQGRLRACRKLVEKYAFKKVRTIRPGGRRRFDSVKSGLREAQGADFILVHDGARPFVDRNLIKRVLFAAKKNGASLCAIAAKQTLKCVGKNFFVSTTPERKFIWEAQTPQAFKKDLIIEAYQKAGQASVTDDASLVEKLGHKVKIVKGSSRNIKITTPEDLALAEILVKRKN